MLRYIYIKKWLPSGLITLGAAAIALAVGADLIGASSRAGWGGKQTFMTGVGFALLVVGTFFALPMGQRYLQELIEPSAESKRSVSDLGIAIWFGLVTGLVEVSILVFRKVAQGEIIYKSQHFLWMIPLGEVSLFVTVALVLAVLARFWKSLVTTRNTIVVFSFIVFFSLMLLFPEVHILGSLVLSLGLAVQLTRFAVAHLDVFYVIVRRTIPTLGVIAVILWIGASLWQTLPEWQSFPR